jgi:hypothetical protein
MSKHLLAWIGCLAVVGLAETLCPAANRPLVLENNRLGLTFDPGTGTLVGLHNKLTGESYAVAGDTLAVDAVEFRAGLSGLRLASCDLQRGLLRLRYEGAGTSLAVTYSLGHDRQFAEKHLTITSNRDYRLKQVILSQPSFSGPDLRIVRYR